MASRKQPKDYHYDSSVGAPEIIAKALEIFGPKGEHWIQGDYSDGAGNFCMIGGLNKARRQLNALPAENRKAKESIACQIKGENRGYVADTIINFNDSASRSFGKVKKVMCAALKDELKVGRKVKRG